eukprot:SAG31_NODE_630_length_13427_cov_27.066327_6_plen_394_part_00
MRSRAYGDSSPLRKKTSFGRHKRLPPHKERSDFICRIKYSNDLPDVPHDMKLLRYPFDPMRYIRRGRDETSLEKAYMRNAPLLAEPDMGVDINLVDPDVYSASDTIPVMHPIDRELVEAQYMDDEKKSSDQGNPFKGPMPGLMSTQYVDPVAKSAARASNWEGVSAPVEGSRHDDPEARLEAVEQTFVDANGFEAELRHKTRPDLVPAEISPLFPDFQRWGYPMVHAAFDENPIGKSRRQRLPDKESQLSFEPKGAIIQGLSLSGNQWMAYFLPRKNAVSEDTNGSATEFSRLRSYTFERPKSSNADKVGTNLLWRSESGMCYKNADSFFRLRKRIKSDDEDKNGREDTEPDKLIVQRRPASEDEQFEIRERIFQIDPQVVQDQDEKDNDVLV